MKSEVLELEDVRAAFGKMTFQGGLKQSKRVEYSLLFGELEKRAKSAKEKFSSLFAAFESVPDAFMLPVCLDESVIKRTEFRVDCQGNRPLAYVGDAYFSLHLAKSCLARKNTPDEFQRQRSDFTSNAHFAAVYDSMFVEGDVILRWNREQAVSEKQKGSFIEGAIGMLVMCGFQAVADEVCEFIMTCTPPVRN